MKNALEGLLYDYLLDKCGKITTEDEREAAKRLADISHRLESSFTKEQSKLMEDYKSSFYSINSCFKKKAFYKGFSFAIALLFEALG